MARLTSPWKGNGIPWLGLPGPSLPGPKREMEFYDQAHQALKGKWNYMDKLTRPWKGNGIIWPSLPSPERVMELYGQAYHGRPWKENGIIWPLARLTRPRTENGIIWPGLPGPERIMKCYVRPSKDNEILWPGPAKRSFGTVVHAIMQLSYQFEMVSLLFGRWFASYKQRPGPRKPISVLWWL